MIIFITGGERSGKSRYAQDLALAQSGNPYYLATSKIWDDDFKERVKRHQEERDDRWTSIEEQFEISKVLPEKGAVVVDCVTLWLTNYFSKYKGDKEQVVSEAKAELNKLLGYQGVLIIISNELGMGLHASTKSGRDFVECQGWINQFIASNADEVYFMVSGLPLKVK
ncbi:bifunctional adenosylcobinamide kinase/adenosylcobinamide-phosphate guanylyltransferase [Fulvivirga sp. 29W222]|uniref:Adenosylcobinamide kinase n=1 Tax=Fulvivirga marina TaxID=2494733 RepID=A0A937FYW0_9BACT|nr:bifunctional adenosylcobinamide kinase/adenosylcobinamide-phosphate guanylyltransferase [Fulvivirga marina]MBL6447021.1 bifunctional adenosylcobinamide kinase/adenosylcobinamide-phosphate guanylyltransferase [Fulvivirga marina]